MNDLLKTVGMRIQRIEAALAPMRDRLDLDWARWNDEHKGEGGGESGGGRGGAGADRSDTATSVATPKEAKAALKFEIGKLTAEFEAAKHEDKQGTMVRVTQRIADKIGKVYRGQGDTPTAVASVIGWAGVSAIGKACTAKAQREYDNDPARLSLRQAAAEEVAKEAVINGDAKKVASSMLIAHTYRGLAEKHGGKAAPSPAASEGRFDRRGPAAPKAPARVVKPKK